MKSVIHFLLIPYTICLLCCKDATIPDKGILDKKKEASKKDRVMDLFDPLLADGFSYPFGDGNGTGSYISPEDKKKYEGWYIATYTGESYELGIHTGEDWNGNGGGDTDLGQPVYSTAKGRVIAAMDYGAPWGNVVYIQHSFVENAKVTTVYSLYAHLNELKVKANDTVKQREQIGTIGTGHHSFAAHLHFEIRYESMKDMEVTYWPSSHQQTLNWVMGHYYVPSTFIQNHRHIGLPASYDTLLIADKSHYQMHLYCKGKKMKTYEIALSQSPVGHKEVEGDNRMPEGEYYITEKNKGPFYGNYKDYFGPAWMRISYPNSFDAENGYQKKIITREKRDAIIKANKSGLQPPKNTELGGGIGIHGWAGDWPVNNRHLTWGCISMRNDDLKRFYDLVPVPVKIFIVP